jgi:hypothetical protein
MPALRGAIIWSLTDPSLPFSLYGFGGSAGEGRDGEGALTRPILLIQEAKTTQKKGEGGPRAGVVGRSAPRGSETSGVC